MALFQRSLLRALSGLFSVVVYVLSFRRARSWLWRKLTGQAKTSKKIVDAKGEIVQ